MKRVVVSLTILLIIGIFKMSAVKEFKVGTPDFEKIKSETLNPNSPNYFPKLLALYQSNDTIMTLEQYRNLYYGYMFQEDYNPYRKSQFSEKIEDLYYKSKHTPAECDTIMKYAELSLADNPFDLRQMTFYIIALKRRKNLQRHPIGNISLINLLLQFLHPEQEQ